MTPSYVTASKEQVSSKGNLGNNLRTDGQDSWARTLPVEQGWGRCKGKLTAAVELWFEVAKGLVSGYPWLGYQRKWTINTFPPRVIQSISDIAFETKI